MLLYSLHILSLLATDYTDYVDYVDYVDYFASEFRPKRKKRWLFSEKPSFCL